MFPANTKVLVIDDMMTMRKIVCKNVRDLGLTNLSEASNGENAWEALVAAHSKGEPFQLVLSDWNMPEITGLELLKKVRADDRFKGLPMILITAEAEKSQVMEAVQSGVSHYITKPFTPDQLKEKLEAVHKKFSGPK